MVILKTLSFALKKKPIRQSGKFIVVDGIDGSGKSTQVGMLKDSLGLAGYETEFIHFPQHGKYSAQLVDAYLAGEFGQLGAQAASVFYALDRFEAATRIRQWIGVGKIVIADRYVTANAAHQGGKVDNRPERLKFFRWLSNLEYEIFKIPKPDLNIILNMPAVISYELVQQRNSRMQSDHVDVMHEASLGHLKRSEEIYREIGTLFPNTKVVDCVNEGQLLPPQQIHNRVWEYVRRIVLKDFKPVR